LISYGGLLKEIHKELQLGEPEDGDLIHIDEDSDEVANGAVDVMAYWHIGLNNYVIKKLGRENERTKRAEKKIWIHAPYWRGIVRLFFRRKGAAREIAESVHLRNHVGSRTRWQASCGNSF